MKKNRCGADPGPHLLVSGPKTRVQHDTIPDSYKEVISSPKEGARKALELIDRGSDVIKTWEDLAQEDYHAIMVAAHSRGVKVHAQLYDPKPIKMAIEAGVDVFQHVGSTGNLPYDDALIHTIAHKEIPVTQTIFFVFGFNPRQWPFRRGLIELSSKQICRTIFNASSWSHFKTFTRFRTLGTRRLRYGTRKDQPAA